MKHFHFYHAETGLLHGDGLAVNGPGAEEMAKANCPPGHKPIEGHLDHLSQRVNVETGEVVDHQPPQPSADHEWHAESKRWRLKKEAAEREAKKAAAPAQIAELRERQHHLVIGYLLGRGGADELRELDKQIAELRGL